MENAGKSQNVWQHLYGEKRAEVSSLTDSLSKLENTCHVCTCEIVRTLPFCVMVGHRDPVLCAGKRGIAISMLELSQTHTHSIQTHTQRRLTLIPSHVERGRTMAIQPFIPSMTHAYLSCTPANHSSRSSPSTPLPIIPANHIPHSSPSTHLLHVWASPP